VLMLSTQNLLSPASGQPVAVPTQDMVLGVYYLTRQKPGTRGEGRTFGSIDEVLMALEHGEVETQTPIRLRYTGPLVDMTTAYDEQAIVHAEVLDVKNHMLNTTAGRVILYDSLPKGMPFINGLLKKKGLGQLVSFTYLRYGPEMTVTMSSVSCTR
jgi:DNA-directed RNA polymerase subunit beta'